MNNKPDHPTALALFSGGLDSILACRVVAEQGINVKAIKFVTPFFDYDLLAKEEQYRQKIREKFKINVILHDISEAYLQLLRHPPHGFGKHFNPCIDCKIMMISEAKKLMAQHNASFLITGEVVGQRPMSQRKDTLRVIERDSETDDILLRPLCAQSQKPTKAEIDGLIDRKKLPDFSGRSRTGQIELAAKFGITDYPAPAGGCVLTDPILSKRLKKLYLEEKVIKVEDARFLLVGRQFKLPNGGWLTLGRDQKENDQVVALRQPGDILLKMSVRPGPTGLLRYSDHPEDVQHGASLVVRYGKKEKNGPTKGEVVVKKDQTVTSLAVSPAVDEIFNDWIR